MRYLDPPYFVKGERRLYANYYESKDHAAIAHALFKVKQNWIVSYDRVAAIRALYQACRSLSYSLGYSASTTNAGDELMFFCHNLIIPKDCRPRASAYKRGELRQGDTSHLRLRSFVEVSWTDEQCVHETLSTKLLSTKLLSTKLPEYQSRLVSNSPPSLP